MTDEDMERLYRISAEKIAVKFVGDQAFLL